jgi:UDP-N-acetylmuramate--alanine ligase
MLADEFAHCFHDCDSLFVLDIYSAGEAAIEGVHATRLAEQIRAVEGGKVEYVDSMETAAAQAAAVAQNGDVVLTLGAGSIWQAGEMVLAALATRGAKVPVGR